MKKRTCYLVDDEPASLNRLERMILQTDGLWLAGRTTDPIVALQLLTSGKVDADIVFLDVNMPELPGLDLKKLLPEDMAVIFTTGHRDFAVEAFEQRAMDYLVKPFNYDRFFKAVEYVIHELDKKSDPGYLFVSKEGKKQKVLYHDIYYFESLNKMVKIQKEEDVITFRGYLADFEGMLPGHIFERVNQSFIINMDKIVFVESKLVTLSNKHKVSIGTNYQKDFLKKINSMSINNKDQ